MKCLWGKPLQCVLGIVGLAAILGCARFAEAQPPGGPGGGPGFGGGFGGFGPTTLLRRDDVRKELELLDDQIKLLDALEQKMRERMRQAFPRPAGPGQEGNRDQPRDQGARKPPTDFRQLFEQINKETTAELSQILLPHQFRRLNQLSAQIRMQGGGMSLLAGDVARDLGVTDQQREQLRTKVEEIERETRKKEAELRRQAREQVIGLLTAEQQAKLKEMIGEPFTFEMQAPPQWPGQPGGGPGQPQGGPGGPGRGDAGRPPRPN